MDYKEARAYLDEAGKTGSILGLESMRALLKELGDPQDALKFIHIAGTNGKGSVLAYLSTILKEAGYRVGRYISPTLFSYRERIQVNEEYITREALAEHTTCIRDAAARLKAAGKPQPTVFEIETALAFLYFVQEKCDIVVLETGMGGDTDATNAVQTTVLEVLVSISRDHMQFLGNTLAEIAAHKAGIIKPGTAVVSARQEPEAMQVIRETAAQQRAKLCIADVVKATDVSCGLWRQSFSYGGYKDLEIHLAGTCQIENAVVAVEAVRALNSLGFKITEGQLRAGLSKTVWRGRFTVLNEKPLFIIDGAHNRGAAEQLKASIETYLKGRRIIAICGVLRDKEYEAVLKTVAPYIKEMITIETPDNPRALPAEKLAEIAGKYIPEVHAAGSIAEAAAESIAKAEREDGVILAFGSLSFLGALAGEAEKVTANGVNSNKINCGGEMPVRCRG
ncbi:MAG: bifunctional folylpolyglutamate synthase/dihydrofolate synthase [Marvinbryantia sp.]|uniref:bifunctional folylpolyglutamate synthase/dihydrofolate synthase n=1 Tax=Marvinbryantia sp. TaxID=2496532 RepID=UPI00399A6D06